MKHIFFQVLLITGLIFAQNVRGQALDRNELEAKIDSLIPSQINDTTPGLVIGVIQHGELIFSKGYGLANLAYGLPNDPAKVYNIGSVSKQFLGYAFAMLHVEGVLNIDDPVNKYLEDWPEFDEPVTVRHLLTHTSGYREAYALSGLAGRPTGIDRLSRDECLEVVRKQPELEFSPGSQFIYNSTAWVILAEIFENVTGQPANVWVTANILDPLGMDDTQIESYVGEVINNAAESYSYEEGKGYVNEKSNRAIFGAADIYTNMQDMAKWVNNFKTTEIGGKKVNALFLDPYILSNGINSGYALGIFTNPYRGLERYSHNGGHEAFITQLSYYPEQNLGIFQVTNFGRDGMLRSTRIAELLIEEQMKSNGGTEIERKKVKVKKLEELAGLYVISKLNRTINLTVVEETLTIDGRTELIPIETNIFRIDGSDSKFRFETLQNSSTQLTIARNNSNETYTKAEPWTPSESDLTTFEGDYWSDELETVYHIHVQNNQLTIKHRWLDDVSLEPVCADLFNSERGYFVKFTRNKEGEISGFNINSSRTLNVFFHRKE